MSITVVTFTYDLPERPELHNEFRDVLMGLQWSYAIGNHELPNMTCWRAFPEGTSEEHALTFSVEQIRAVITKIRESGHPQFKVQRYYFLAHKVPDALARFGEDLF